MIALLWLGLVLASLASPFKSKGQLAAENMAVRHQVMVRRREARGKIRLTHEPRSAVSGPALPLVSVDPTWKALAWVPSLPFPW